MKITLCSVCYLEKDGKLLMLYRNKKEKDINKGKWIGVGGHFEKNETPYECAIREIKEETGYIANSLIPLGLISFITQNSDEMMYIYVFLCKDFYGEQIECSEGELSWIDKKEILNLNVWQTDEFFLKRIINGNYSFFMQKAVYDDNNNLVYDIIEYE